MELRAARSPRQRCAPAARRSAARRAAPTSARGPRAPGTGSWRRRVSCSSSTGTPGPGWADHRRVRHLAAGFYTYFRDKQEIFNALGVAAYRAVLNAIEAWDDLPSPGGAVAVRRGDLTDWVAGYFAIMDEHGPFIFSAAQSAPTDEQTQADAHRMQMRTAWALGDPGCRPVSASPPDPGRPRPHRAGAARPLLVLQPLGEPPGQRPGYGRRRRPTGSPPSSARPSLPGRGGGQLVVGAAVVRVDGVHDASADLAQLPGLGLGQRVED